MLRDAAPPPDSLALALQALGFVLADEARADRLLALTGLTPDAVRASLARGEEAVPAAALDFLMGNERDLLAAADSLGVRPEVLADAARRLNGAA